MKILYLFFYLFFFKVIAIELNFECGGTFRIDKEFTLSDGSKYSQFSNYGTCSGELGIYNASYCFGTFKTKDNIIIDSEFLCENTYNDNEKAWVKAKRIPNTELDSSLGEMIFIDATGKWKTLIGTKCKYGIKFINLPEYSSSLSNHKCDITEKQKKILESK